MFGHDRVIGAWPIDVAKSYNVHVDAVDINTKFFPRQFPPNITFSEISVTNLPPSWTGRFDLVHQRVMLSALTTSDWSKALSQYLRVLRPGGSAQFSEGVFIWADTAAGQRHKAFLQALTNKSGHIWDIALKLPTILTQVGFVNVHAEKKNFRMGPKGAGPDVAEARACLGGALRAMKGAGVQSGTIGPAEFDAMMDDIEKEWDQGIGANMQLVVVHARKPE
jgi:SAM-dependent methyltransferase